MKTRTITKRIASFINWFINLPAPERLLYEVLIVFFMLPALLISLPLLGRLLIFVTGWDACNVNVVFGRVFIVIEFPVILVFWLIGGIIWGICYFILGVDCSENPVLYFASTILLFAYNVALIVGCLELIRQIVLFIQRYACPSNVLRQDMPVGEISCPTDVLTSKNAASNAKTDEN